MKNSTGVLSELKCIFSVIFNLNDIRYVTIWYLLLLTKLLEREDSSHWPNELKCIFSAIFLVICNPLVHM